MEQNNNFETFYADLVNTASSLRLTVPKQIVEGAGYKAGDKFKVRIEKVENEHRDSTE